MATTTAVFKIRFPEFANHTDARVQLFLDDAALLMSNNASGRWLSYYDIAHANLGAHLLVAGDATEVGDINALSPIKKQDVDDVLVEFAVSEQSVTAEDLYSTSYGKAYLRYRQICFAGIVGV